jgi:predicted dehydrogenase
MTDTSLKAVPALRWGILSTGRIAAAFADSLRGAPGAQIVAVGSRGADSAAEFAARYEIPRAHASYEALAADPDVQAVYIGTPHPLHAENALLCLQAGKHVLLEKPFTLNSIEAERIVAEARARRLFLMEAMWTRFLPAPSHARQLVRDGAIGEPWFVSADLGFRAAYDPQGRLFNPALGGGALLDIGCYVVSLASWFFGAPDQTACAAKMALTGVDESAVIQLGYPGGQLAALAVSIGVRTPADAVISGTEGMLRIHSRFHHPTKLTLTPAEGDERVLTMPYERGGLQYQALEVARCVAEGQTESATMPLDESVQIMRTLDALRAEIGLRYPGE